jgi:hypothetical protein
MQEFQFSAKVRPLSLENAFGGRLRVLALKDDENAIFWVQDKQAAWGRIQVQKKVPSLVKGARIKAGRFVKGTYAVKWINTFSGKEILSVVLKAEKGLLPLEIPAFRRDIACLIKKTE